MRKYFASIFAFLVPILRTAIIQVAADELSRVAYPARSRRRVYTGPYESYNRVGRAQARTREHGDLVATLRKERGEGRSYAYIASKHDMAESSVRSLLNPEPSIQGPFHDVLMVAFDLSGPDTENVHQWLMDNMPEAGAHGDKDEIYLDSWWIANDERFDWTGTDSAVFVIKGKQEEARNLLREHGLAR